ncbi:MAG: hypothetical protein DI561_04630 [Thauera sp.]|nr:MAG: hypothetical protein DI561_04630 [Thauera sp.]
MILERMFERCDSEQSPAADVLRELRAALILDLPFDVQRLYALSYGDFVQALEALREWRSQRYIYQGQLLQTVAKAPADCISA